MLFTCQWADTFPPKQKRNGQQKNEFTCSPPVLSGRIMDTNFTSMKMECDYIRLKTGHIRKILTRDLVGKEEEEEEQILILGPRFRSRTVFRIPHCRPPRWHSGKASASRVEDPVFKSRLRRDFFRGRVIPVTQKLALQWLPCQVPGVIGSALGLVGPVSVYCDWVR